MTYTKPTIPTGISGIYHHVEKGQTLWAISRMYNVDLEELTQLNHISDITKIEIGQSIFIPTMKKTTTLEVGYSASDDFIWPIKGRVISEYNQSARNLVNKGLNIKPNIDLNIVASRKGKVVFCSNNMGSFGKTIIIDHGDDLSTIYSRNEQLFVRPGDIVKKGDIIAKAGSTERDKSVYLHFEIRKGHIPQNPYFYLP